jgi:hypothetical protein
MLEQRLLKLSGSFSPPAPRPDPQAFGRQAGRAFPASVSYLDLINTAGNLLRPVK